MLAATVLAGFAAALPHAGAALINPDFETGDLTGWTTFTTGNGTIGTPAVVSFDTTGNGASLAAQFTVGQVVFGGPAEGGWLLQAFTTGAGVLTLSVNVAAKGGPTFSNGDGGTFTLLIDSVVVDTFVSGAIGVDEIKRDTLTFSAPVLAGLHEVQILMTRPFTTSTTVPTQYVDNVMLSGTAVLVQGTAVPEPTTALFGTALLGAIGLSRRRVRNAGDVLA